MTNCKNRNHEVEKKHAHTIFFKMIGFCILANKGGAKTGAIYTAVSVGDGPGKAVLR